MTRYIVKRVLMLLVTVFCAAIVVFTLMYISPYDPARILLGGDPTPEALEAKRVALGLDKSYLQQLVTYLSDIFLHLDFGDSWVYGVPVMSELAARLPRTLIVGLCAMVINVIIGVGMGIFAAVHEGKWQDSAIMVIAMAFISVPDFWVALMLIILLCQRLNLLPAFYTVGDWRSYVLPIICSSFGGVAVNARQARSSMLEVIRADFVTTARSKGQKESKVVMNHMLPNAMMPIITGLGGGLSMIVAGSAVIESVFSIPGVGAYLLTGLNSRDYPVVRGSVIFLATFSGIIMLLVDLAYAFLDPRIKAQYATGRRAK
ncbi:MAG: ABC transporter permease [Clostridiales bacterium]|nr:ABC transporter permease [Clostridiales bacterium]